MSSFSGASGAASGCAPPDAAASAFPAGGFSAGAGAFSGGFGEAAGAPEIRAHPAEVAGGQGADHVQLLLDHAVPCVHRGSAAEP